MSEDAEKTLAKIRALLARATHETTPPEEARTSAHLAAKLIVSHGFSVIGIVSHSNGYEKPPPTSAQEVKRSRSAAGMKNYAVFTSKYRGRCVSCGAPYAIGDRIAWRRGEGTTHYTCREFWDRLDDEAS